MIKNQDRRFLATDEIQVSVPPPKGLGHNPVE